MLQIEAYRCREKLLLRDYEALRLRARHAGIDVSPPAPQQPQPNGGASGAQQPTAQPDVSPLQQAASVRSGGGAALPQHLALTPLDGSHPLWLYVNGSRVRSSSAWRSLAVCHAHGVCATRSCSGDAGRLQCQKCMSSTNRILIGSAC